MTGAKLCGFLATTKPEEARAFLEKLGLSFVTDDGFALVFDSNGSTVRVAKTKSFTPQPFTVLGWEVPDMDAALKRLEAAGIALERYLFLPLDGRGVMTFETGDQVAWFKDPDGNTLSFAQMAARG